ncbi:hypothetical protein BGZ76_004829 [Entomortierella beljakovae]|nr:hypothetical protein BGZ76_004829 [Entomortierella beljakovae]
MALKRYEHAPFIDYLALFRDQTTRYEFIAWDYEIRWRKDNTNTPYVHSFYSAIRTAFATHRPAVVRQLYISMEFMSKLIDHAPQFTNLQSLEVYSLIKNPDIGPLVEFILKHKSSNVGTLTELSLSTPHCKNHMETTPLSLYGMSNLTKLDLALCLSRFKWESLPRRYLVELRFDARILPVPFDLAQLLRSCTKLQTLGIISINSQTFNWVSYEKSNAILPQLEALEIGGPRDDLKGCLEKVLQSLSERLVTLTVTLQESDEVRFIRKELTWTTLLPRLKKLIIKDKACFGIDMGVIKTCPVLHSLTLHISSRDRVPCGFGNTNIVKWVMLHKTFEELGEYGNKLEEIVFDGFWGVAPEGLICKGLLPLKQLQRIRITGNMDRMTSSMLCTIAETFESLRLLEVPSILFRKHDRKLVEKDGLEFRLVNNRYIFLRCE